MGQFCLKEFTAGLFWIKSTLFPKTMNETFSRSFGGARIRKLSRHFSIFWNVFDKQRSNARIQQSTARYKVWPKLWYLSGQPKYQILGNRFKNSFKVVRLVMHPIKSLNHELHKSFCFMKNDQLLVNVRKKQNTFWLM